MFTWFYIYIYIYIYIYSNNILFASMDWNIWQSKYKKVTHFSQRHQFHAISSSVPGKSPQTDHTALLVLTGIWVVLDGGVSGIVAMETVMKIIVGCVILSQIITLLIVMGTTVLLQQFQ